MNSELRMGEQIRGEHLDFDVGRERVKVIDAGRDALMSVGSARKTSTLKKNKAKRQARKQQRGR